MDWNSEAINITNNKYTYVCSLPHIIYSLWDCTNQFCCGHKMCSEVITHKLTGNPWPCFRPAMGGSKCSPHPLIGQWAAILASDWLITFTCPGLGLWLVFELQHWPLIGRCPKRVLDIRKRSEQELLLLLLSGCCYAVIIRYSWTEQQQSFQESGH